MQATPSTPPVFDLSPTAFPAIYLASQSPRRQALLQQIGVSFELLLPDAQEDAESLEAAHPGEAPLAYVQRVTRLKAEAAQQRLQQRGLAPRPILVADTTVACAQAILGKPRDADDALRILQTLSGQTHQVHTALALVHPEHSAASPRLRECVNTSEVSFRDVSTAEWQAYIATGEPFGKAGAYGIQGYAACFIRHIAGSYTGIMGLPLYETAALLNAASRPTVL